MTKMVSRLALLASLLIFQVGCKPVELTPAVPEPSQEEQNENPVTVEPSGKTLVVYYSFTGNCKTLAAVLAGYAGADVLEIQPAQEGLDYAANNYAIGSSLIAAIREKPNDPASYPAIKAVNRDAADYENIVIVTPLWWSNMAAIMQSYLFKEGSKLKDKKVGLIVSSASSGISSVVADAKRLVPEAKWAGEALWINNSNRSKSDELVKEWWDGLNKSEDTMPVEIKITVSGKSLPVKIEDNVATKALVAALREASITYEAHDYGGFEKVGGIGRTLPSGDSQITTQPGDVILYASDQIVLFYGSNSWSYTRIGKIQYGTLDELKSFLQAGKGNISVTLSL
jgi:flavodoxin